MQTSLIEFERIDDGSAAEKIDQMIELLISKSKNYSVLNVENDLDSQTHPCNMVRLSVFKKIGWDT